MENIKITQTVKLSKKEVKNMEINTYGVKQYFGINKRVNKLNFDISKVNNPEASLS